MLTSAMLDRLRDPIDHAVETDPAEGRKLDSGSHEPLVGDDALVDEVETILRRLARRRSGRDDVDIAFRPDELRRLRRVLAAAGRAHGRVVRSSRASISGPMAC